MENVKRLRSKKLIEEAFLEEVQIKKIEDITVVEICKKAQVNRSTFYSNYLDIYDLLEQVANEFFINMFYECVVDLGDEPNEKGTAKGIVGRALNITYEKRKICKVLLKPTYNNNFAQKLLEALLEWGKKRYINYSGKNVERFRLEAIIFLGGIIVLWQTWIENDFNESKELLANTICEYIEYNANRIWSIR